MLFGRRPFGHDQTQERILREDTIINARKVEFPSRPTVSNEAKASFDYFMYCFMFLKLQLFGCVDYYSIQKSKEDFLSYFFKQKINWP